ncbi:MAG: hypothetical protein RMI34_00975 [Chloroherpetonaceae bacterium]|nr:hypothetical protein [Chloroherpetonaceae bacterium]MCS7211695.1 hypothetical protein [Chloroherpetonaceae bacterium]MDW8018633.1 hypothetical protein [Chloroherpetonaceae bacterium]MDW8465417.1 hypothetical protein [Chloroherpetonaceae bacterium]
MLGITEEILRDTQAFQEILAEGREEGRAQGLAQGREEGKLEAVPILREMGLSDEVIAEKLNLPLEKVRSVPLR